MRKFVLTTVILVLISCKSTPPTEILPPLSEPEEPIDYVEYDHSYREKAYRALDRDKKIITSNNDVEIILNAYSWAFMGSDCINPLVETVDDLFTYDSFNIKDPGMGDLIFFVDDNGEPYRVGMLESKTEDKFSFLLLNSSDRLSYYSEFLDLSKVVVKRLRPTKK